MEKDWICVFQTEQGFQAEMAKEMIENEGIDCVISNPNGSVFPSISNYEVWTHSDFKTKVAEILKNIAH